MWAGDRKIVSVIRCSHLLAYKRPVMNERVAQPHSLFLFCLCSFPAVFSANEHILSPLPPVQDDMLDFWIGLLCFCAIFHQTLCCGTLQPPVFFADLMQFGQEKQVKSKKTTQPCIHKGLAPSGFMTTLGVFIRRSNGPLARVTWCYQKNEVATSSINHWGYLSV